MGIAPEHLGTIALGSAEPLGQPGLLLALVGILFAVGGASIDTVFSGAYNLAQFCGWEWGRYRHPRGAPRFALTWIVFLALGMLIAMTGVDAVALTEYAVIFSVVALPLTYIPILLVANDSSYMGQHANGKLANALGIVYLVVIGLISIAALPSSSSRTRDRDELRDRHRAARARPSAARCRRAPVRKGRRPRDRRRAGRGSAGRRPPRRPRILATTRRPDRLHRCHGSAETAKSASHGSTSPPSTPRSGSRRPLPSSDSDCGDDRLGRYLEKIPGVDR